MQLTHVHPKLPMRNKATTRHFYTQILGFKDRASNDYPDYLILGKDQIELHFFTHTKLIPEQNDGQVYIRVHDIVALFKQWTLQNVPIHPNGALAIKPWGVKEFSILDPDMNLLTFGEMVYIDTAAP